MTDINTEDISSHPFFVHADFPFVFIPSTSGAGFTFSNEYSQMYTDENSMTAEEEQKIRDNHKEENEQKHNLRISQPKYSQLLKDLDFTETRMYDVTKLLSDEGGTYVTTDDNENPKKTSTDDKYQSLSSVLSTTSSDESVNRRSSPFVDKRIKETNDSKNATENVSNDLNHLFAMIQEVSQRSSEEYDIRLENDGNIHIDIQQKAPTEETDDTSKQTTPNYELNDNEQEGIALSNRNVRLTAQTSNSTQDDNLSSIPRLNNRLDNQEEYHLDWNELINGTDGFMQPSTVVIFAQSIEDIPTTPNMQPPLSTPDEKSKQRGNSSPKQKIRQRARQLSDSDSPSEHIVHQSKPRHQSASQPQLIITEDFDDPKEILNEHERPYTSASNILLRRLSSQQTSPHKKKSAHHHHRCASLRHVEHDETLQSLTNDTWVAMLEKLEREHKERLEKQQKQYENYMLSLEEKMKQRFEEYLCSSNNLKESKSASVSSTPIDSNSGRCSMMSQPQRPSPKDHYSSMTHVSTSDRRQATGPNLARSHSREDISIVRTELSSKHAKHVSDLKLYYEHEIDDLKNQLNNSKMGHSSSSTRQSLETIERINNENIRLHEEMKEMRHSLKSVADENISLKRQLEELRDQLNRKDVDLRNHRRTMSEVEKQLNEAREIKERQMEKLRHADRQTLFFQNENEKITSDLNLTRERLVRLEERYRDLENDCKVFRQQGFVNENSNPRVNDNQVFNSTAPLNVPTSREYGRFSSSTTRYSSSTVASPRNTNPETGRYTSYDDIFRHANTTRPLLTLNDYLNEKPTFPPPYVPPSRPLYSPRKGSPNQYRADQMPVRDLIDSQMKQSEQLEERFDDFLKKKRDLESRINRIPTRGVTSADRQLLEVLERELERVEQQISSLKLELRKMNILRTH